MPIRLEEALNHPSFLEADPIVRAGFKTAAGTQIRWIHSSEVLDIAPLLRGGELLLTGGQALTSASEARRVSYIQELAKRGVAALAVETGTVLPSLPSSMVSAAEAAGFPLIELRGVVPFVTVMQALNSMLVSQSVSNLQRADEASHAMAVELAHGGSLDRLLAVLAGITGTQVDLTSTTGAALASAGSGIAAVDDTSNAKEMTGQGGRLISFDVTVRGIPSARLDLHVPADADANLARVAGSRSVDILALALLQRMPPRLKEVAGAALVRAVDSGTPSWRLQQLAPEAGIPITASLVALVVRSSSSQQLQGTVEQVLFRAGQRGASYVDKDELLVLAVLQGEVPGASRSALLAGLRKLNAPAGTSSAVGPLVVGISQAPWSLSQARLTLDLGDAGSATAPFTEAADTVLDAEAFAVERFAVESLDIGLRNGFVRQQLGSLLDHDAQRRSQLITTLLVWLDSGCNTAEAARRLHVERQSMHQRLRKIFELCGGDPRETGRLAAMHLAARLATLQR